MQTIAAVPPDSTEWIKGECLGGHVFLAMSVATGGLFAIKQVDPNDVQQAQALRSQIAILRGFAHPKVVGYLGAEDTDSAMNLWLEYVPGGSIGALLRNYGAFELALCRNFMRQILAGVGYIHSRGVMHRDLKGDSILVDNAGTCKIAGFGAAIRSGDIYASAPAPRMIGSVFWMAPEALQDICVYSAKVDIWSAGCVLVEMHTGKKPWGAAADVQDVSSRLSGTGEHPPIADIAPAAENFLAKCFAADPERRPTAAALEIHPWLADAGADVAF